jgi:hypothetical protein
MKTTKTILTGLTMSLLMSCGGGLNGVYKGKTAYGLADIEIKFISSSKAQFTANGSTSEVAYEKDGDEVKFIVGEKNDIFKIDENNCLVNGKTKLCKEE